MATALVLVRNDCNYDSRIFREARTLAGLGFDVRVVGVVSTREAAREALVRGIPVLRLAPSSPLRFVWRQVRRLRSPATQSGPASPGGPVKASPEPHAEPPTGGVRASAIRLHRWLTTLDYYRRGIRAVLSLRPALVHCNDYNTMWIGVAARALVGSAVVYDSHELWPDRNQRPEPRWWLMLCEAVFVRTANCCVTTSPGYADVLAARYRIERPEVVRNIPEPPASLAGSNGADPEGHLAVYAGALTSNRGLEQAIRALALVPHVRLRLLGPGRPAYIGELGALAEELSVADRVEILPPVPPGELVTALGKGDLGLALIQPSCLSYRLTLPNKLFEYVAAGLPILASDLPVMAGFVREHGLGAVVSPESAQAIADHLTRLLDPDVNAEYRHAAAQAAQDLTWARERRVLEGVYRTAAGAA